MTAAWRRRCGDAALRVTDVNQKPEPAVCVEPAHLGPREKPVYKIYGSNRAPLHSAPEEFFFPCTPNRPRVRPLFLSPKGFGPRLLFASMENK